MSTILVGELNPFGGKPGFALWPEPENCSGGRLMRILGMTRHDYVRTRRENLCTGRWSMAKARKAATALLAEAFLTDYVLLGKKVQEAFDFCGPQFSSLPIVRADVFGCDGKKRAYFLPHPSGRCRVWNGPDAVIQARTLLNGVLAVGSAKRGPKTSWTADPNRRPAPWSNVVEDFSRLRIETDEHPNVRYIFEPLAHLITDEDLWPSCYLGESVAFHNWWDHERVTSEAIHDSWHLWHAGDVVESDGKRFELAGGRCLYHRGRWCMRWTGYLTTKPLTPSKRFIDIQKFHERRK